MKKTKIIGYIIAILVIGTGIFMTGYSFAFRKQATEPPPRQPQWSAWGTPAKSECSAFPGYIQFRQDTNTGLAEIRSVLEAQ